MQDPEPAIMGRLLERLLAARARRDREERFSESWQAADAEMHAIERAIFRVPAAGSEPATSRPVTFGSREGPRHAPGHRREERKRAARERPRAPHEAERPG